MEIRLVGDKADNRTALYHEDGSTLPIRHLMGECTTVTDLPKRLVHAHWAKPSPLINPCYKKEDNGYGATRATLDWCSEI